MGQFMCWINLFYQISLTFLPVKIFLRPLFLEFRFLRYTLAKSQLICPRMDLEKKEGVRATWIVIEW